MVLTLEANKVKWVLRFPTNDSDATIQLQDILNMMTNIFSVTLDTNVVGEFFLWIRKNVKPGDEQRIFTLTHST